MRTKTLKRFNLLTVLLLVVAIAVTCCAFYIGDGLKSVVDRGEGEQVDMSISDNMILTDTNGTLPDGTELVIPEGYTGVEITNEAELKAFILDADAATLKYGYLQPADGAKSISIDWAANGAPSGITANKILDGRGYLVDIATTTEDGGNFVRQIITKEGSLIDKDIRTGGLFVTSNFGTIKNVQFTFSKAVSLKCDQEWTTTYGIITGYNAGVIDNISLDIKSGATFKISKNAPSSPTSSTDQCTVLAGGIAGTNASAIADLGVVDNATVNNDGEMWVEATYLGKNWAWGSSAINGSSRSSLGLLVGRMQGLTTVVKNCVVKGGGSIKAATKGSSQSGTQYRNIATAVAANNGYSGTQDSAYGTINGIIDAFTGTMEGSTSGQGHYGTFDCAENVSNVYRPMARVTAKKLMNCSCDHNKLNTYRTIESKGVNLNYGFSANPGEVAYTTNIAEEDVSLQLFESSTSTSTVSGYTATSTITVVKNYNDNITADTSGVMETDTNKTFGSIAISYYNELEMLLKQDASLNLPYNGNTQVPELVLEEKQTNNPYTVNSAKMNYIYAQDNQLINGAILPGSYSVKVKDTTYVDFSYYEEKNGKIYASKYVADKDIDYTIYKANITTNTVGTDWVNDLTYNIDMTGFAADAFDAIEYSNDNGATWTKLDTTSLVVTLNSANVSYLIRAYKSDVLCTENYDAGTINFDNLSPTIKDVNFVDNWTIDDITATFTVEDSLSGLKGVSIVHGETNTQLTADEHGIFTFVMTEHIEYVITVTDNGGNVSTHTITPKIDKQAPTVTVAATYKTLDSRSEYVSGTKVYTSIYLDVTKTMGVSGAILYYGEVIDDTVAYTEMEIVDGGYKLTYSEVVNKNLRFKVTNGAGVDVTQDFNVVISRYNITITNSNLSMADDALTKIYDANANVLGTITFKDLVDFGVGNVEEDVAQRLSVTAVYNDKVVGTGKTVSYTLAVDPAYADQYVITDNLTDTNNGIITKHDVKLIINTQTREYFDANPAVFDYRYEGVYNSEESDISIVLSYDAVQSSNVGNYNIDLDSFTSTNYNIVLASDNEEVGKLVIIPRKAIVEFENYAGLKYNGQEQQLNAFYTDLDNAKHNLNVTFDNTPINAGSYVATASFPEGSNYMNSTGIDTWRFKIAKTSATITAENKEVDYNGNVHSIVYNADRPAVVTYNGSANAPSNGGRYVVAITVAGDENYNTTVKEVVLIINKIKFDGTVVFNDKTFTYNGEKQSLNVEGAPAGTTVVYKENEQINVGRYTVTATVMNDNYHDIRVEAVMTIVKKVFDTLTMDNMTVTYDGNTHSLTVDGTPVDAIITFANNGKVNAGNYTVKATITGDNYEEVVLHADLIIEKAELPSDIMFDDTYSEFDYDGIARTFTLLGDLTGFTVVYKTNVAHEAGLTFVRATVSAPNYKETTLTLSVVVNKIQVEVTYNGLPKNDMLKPGVALPTITASYVDVDGNIVDVEVSVSGDLSTDEYVTIKAILGRNYVATDSTALMYVDIDDSTGPSTAVIVGASVGGSVGGLAVIGGIVAFFIIKKKKSIV